MLENNLTFFCSKVQLNLAVNYGREVDVSAFS